MSKLKGKVALVTGAGSGLGAATARLLSEHGVAIALLSRTAEQVESLAREIVAEGGEAAALCADISDEQKLQKAIETIGDRWGRLDVVFANAGVNGVWAQLDQLSLEEWEQTIRINLTGTFLTIRSALPLLKERGGSVIITSSVNGTRMFSNTGATAYACSKAGQVAFAKMIAVELAKWDIRVNVICPGAIESQIDENTEKRNLEDVGVPVEFPKGPIPLTGTRPGRALDVAQLVLFLASDESRHITGTEIYIDGAQSLVQG
jgi:NAD(P)-dependent dehydrogenase (short-subunit alcohol dehydrogenase family)